MQTFRPLLLCLIVLFVVVPTVAEDEVKPDPRTNLKTAIPEGIRLLEAKDYVTFLKSFVIPSDLESITKDTSLEEFAKRFAERSAPRLLEVLKEIKDENPELDDTGTKATFTLKPGKSGKKTITLVKIKKYWYIQN